mmetsp:Transcript_3357/g.6577  ORF Transcript_3357/g.6577 Transcript_3357/m.6577 type:complete len:87 (+) Transcript_3357:902-1162(+)
MKVLSKQQISYLLRLVWLGLFRSLAFSQMENLGLEEAMMVNSVGWSPFWYFFALGDWYSTRCSRALDPGVRGHDTGEGSELLPEVA